MIVVEHATLMEWLAGFLLVSVRISAMMLAAPIYSAASISTPVRVLLTVAVASVLVGRIPVPVVDLLSFAGVLALVREVLIGVAIGFVMQIAFAAVAVAGEQISYAMGLGFAAMIDPQTGTQSPVVTQFISIMMVLVFLSLEGHHILLEQLAASFKILPIGGAMLDQKMFRAIVEAGGLLFSAAFVLALPIVLAITLVNIVIGMLTRVAPQMNIFSIGFPVTIIAGLVLLLVSVPNLSGGMAGLLDEVARRMREAVLAGRG